MRRYGAPFEETRAFVGVGWADVCNAEGDLSRKGPLYRLALRDFEDDVCPLLRPGDCLCLVLLTGDGDGNDYGRDGSGVSDGGLPPALASAVAAARAACPAVAVVCLGAAMGPHAAAAAAAMEAAAREVGATAVSAVVVPTGGGGDGNADGSLPFFASSPPSSLGSTDEGSTDEGSTDDGRGAWRQQWWRLAAASDGLGILSLKLMLNAVSTFAQACGKGAVFHGRMICTGPTNDKIYNRCVRLIAEFVPGATHASATDALLRAIYRTDALAPGLRAAPTSTHIKAATPSLHDATSAAQVTLPLAFLLALRDSGGNGAFTVTSALAALASEPRVRVLLEAEISRSAQGGAPSEAPPSEAPTSDALRRLPFGSGSHNGCGGHRSAVPVPLAQVEELLAMAQVSNAARVCRVRALFLIE